MHQAALHEIGHALGLDHSPDEASAMYPEPWRTRARLARSDLAGIHSLYGGGVSGAGDLVIRTADEAPAIATLYGVAPPALTGWDVFDADGDGRQEVLVWRTDPAGAGALWIYFFSRGPCLERTLGPLYGVVAPQSEVRFLRDGRARRLLLQELPSGRRQARIFAGDGLSTPLPEDELGPLLPVSLAEPSRERAGDLDGDGRAERVVAGSG